VPASPPHNEKELLLQLMQGDADAFSEIYEVYKDKVFAFAFTLTKSKDIAEDAVQEVFVKLWEKRAQINTELSFNAYVKTIAYRCIIDFFRSMKRDRTLQQQLQSNMEALRDSTEDALIGKELNRLYQQAVEQLTPQQKRIYALSREQQLNYQEIADEIGISRHTVRNHMAEAIRFIRAYITTHSDLACVILAICMHRNAR
jgi:RNA polymerase sigma-70 factor (ECF subfamily)